MSFNTGEGSNVTPAPATEPSAHPLVEELAALLRTSPASARRVLLLGIGSGRHVPFLLAAGARVEAIEEDAERAAAASHRFEREPRVRIVCARYAGPFAQHDFYDAALSTNALLHGTRSDVAAALAATHARLSPGAHVYATFGSTRDPRFGAGTRIDDDTFAPLSGSEAGIAHAYFDERGVRDLLHAYDIVRLTEMDASASTGRWAHTDAEAAELVHWFAQVRRR